MLDWATEIVNRIAVFLQMEPVASYYVGPPLAILFVSLSCGMVGSLVIGNRMAFFSDAMAHTAFAGVAFALIGIVVFTGIRSTLDADAYLWVVPYVMVTVGAIVGLAVAFVRDYSGLTNDTVIGVFFALSVGFAATFLPSLRQFVNIDPEQLLFASVVFVDETDLRTLLAMVAITAVVIGLRYNALVLASFNPSLARSRGVPSRFDSYLFVVLLAIVVNLSIMAVGVLLINALLIVPAAAAAGLARNLRQMFWFTIFGSIGCALLGYEISQRVAIPVGIGRELRFGPGGTIVMVCVAWFFLAIILNSFRSHKRRNRLSDN